MKKVYNNTGIGMAAFLGGPLAAGYLFSKNYQALKKNKLSKRSILISVLITVIVFGSIPFIPVEIDEKIPNYLFPIIFLGISRLLADRYQKADIEDFISDGGGILFELESCWNLTNFCCHHFYQSNYYFRFDRLINALTMHNNTYQ